MQSPVCLTFLAVFDGLVKPASCTEVSNIIFVEFVHSDLRSLYKELLSGWTFNYKSL